MIKVGDLIRRKYDRYDNRAKEGDVGVVVGTYFSSLLGDQILVTKYFTGEVCKEASTAVDPVKTETEGPNDNE